MVQLDLFAQSSPRTVVCRVPDGCERFDLAAEDVTYLGAGLHVGGGVVPRGHWRSVRHLTRAWLRKVDVVRIVTRDDASETVTVAVPRAALVILRTDLPTLSPPTWDGAK